MATKRPTPKAKTVKPKLIKHDAYSVRPFVALSRALYNSSEKRAAKKANKQETTRFNEEDKAYQSSLKKMGATVKGGGRANVKLAGASNPPSKKRT